MANQKHSLLANAAQHRRQQPTPNNGKPMIKSNYAELLSILKDAPGAGLSTADIFKVACDNVKSEIPDPSYLSKILYATRSQGYITTSTGGKKLHKITPQGVAALDGYGTMAETPKKGAEEKANVKAQEPEPVAARQPDVAMEEPGKAPVEAEAHNDGADADDALAETLAPYLLDPSDGLEAMLIGILNHVRALPEPPVIERKAIKIDSLRSLAGLMSDDINKLFNSIASDLERFDDIDAGT